MRAEPIDFPDDRVLRDGIYEVSDDIEVLELEGEAQELRAEDRTKALKFMARYPDYYMASAYQCYATFLLSKKPNKFGGEYSGSGFNAGSTNLLSDCPRRVLILAEND